MTEAVLIDGKARAAELRARVAKAVADLEERHGAVPGLAVVQLGDDPASSVYVNSKNRLAAECGIRSLGYRRSGDTGEAELLDEIDRLNGDDDVDGILVQLPLPDHIDAGRVLDRIDPVKDVDGFHPVNVGLLVTGGEAPVPCTPLGCLLMLREQLGDMSGKTAVIVGRSNIVGKPMAALLTREHCTVTVAHSRTRDLPAVCRGADILVAAVGRPEMIRGDWIGPGATVIDVGINRIAAPERGPDRTRLVGDVAFDEARAVAGAITPVPGGVGPMTIACLLRNTLEAACRRRGWPMPEL